MTPENAIGKIDSHITFSLLEVPVHQEVVEPILRLKNDAAEEGYDLRLASGFRSFERQLAIWNRKATGQVPVLDSRGEPLAVDALSDREKVLAILRWSALPGASRHHWGTDIDIYDASAIDPDYRVQLTVAETCNGGPFEAMHSWLGDYLSARPEEFFRPYEIDRGGVAPEPWHLSYRPLAEQYAALLSEDLLIRVIKASEVELKATILENFDLIYERFIININSER